MKTLKLFALAFSFFIPFAVFGQHKPLTEQDGISLSYTLSKIKEDGKKDIYLIVVKASNKSVDDAFYQAPKNGVNPFFASVTVRNTDDKVYLTGTESKLLTADGKLFYLKKGSSLSFEKEFKINKGVEPVVTGSFYGALKPISDFR